MKKVMVCLVGEQPLPNILPIRHYNAEGVFLLHTERTAQMSSRLENILKSTSNVLSIKVSPYDINEVRQVVEGLSSRYGWSRPDLIFNLTGGTKPMAYACYDLAHTWRSPFCYLQSERSQSVLYHYDWEKDSHSLNYCKTSLNDLLSIDEYLKIHVDSFESGEPRNDLEAAVLATLQSCSDFEVLWSVKHSGLGALEIDFVIRAGNQFGVGEVKSQANKKAIDQIASAANRLGTYVKKFLVSASPLDPNNADLAKAYGIQVIYVKASEDPRVLDSSSQQSCCDIIRNSLVGASPSPSLGCAQGHSRPCAEGGRRAGG